MNKKIKKTRKKEKREAKIEKEGKKHIQRCKEIENESEEEKGEGLNK